MMPTTPTYPIGIVEQHDGDAIRFNMLPQNGRSMPKEGDNVIIWNQSEMGGPMAKVRGVIHQINDEFGMFEIQEQYIDISWPVGLDAFGAGNPVYLAHRDSFNPDMSRVSTIEEYEMLLRLAREHEERSGIPPIAGYVVDDDNLGVDYFYDDYDDEDFDD